MEIALREWTLQDKAQLIGLCNNADRSFLSDRMPFPYTEKDAEWWLNMVREHDGKDGVFRAVVSDGKIVGNISAEQKADVYRRDAEIGYLLDRAEWSKGIMTQAVKLLCETAFERLDILRITGLVYETNAASRRVLEKNVFELEGVMRSAVTKGGRTYDLCVYGKLK